MESNISRDLKKWREKADLTQQELADKVHVRRETVVHWENPEEPEKWPKKANCLLLSDILSVKVTTKGIIENHIDMKTEEDAQTDADKDEKGKKWYKKTIDSLIGQHKTIIEKYTARTDKQIDGLEKDKSNLWDLIHSVRPGYREKAHNKNGE